MTAVSLLLVKERLQDNSAYYKLKMQIARGYINFRKRIRTKTAQTDGFGGLITVPPDCMSSELCLVSEYSVAKSSDRAVVGIYLWFVRIFISL